MGQFVADATIKQLVLAGKAPAQCKVVIFGLTFKENCPDTRNSKVEDIIIRLKEYGIEPVVVDPWADEKDALHEYGVELQPIEAAIGADCIIFAVAHEQFRTMTLADINALYKSEDNDKKVLIDVKGLFTIKDVNNYGVRYWRL